MRVPFTVKVAASAAALVIMSLAVFAYFAYRQHTAMILDTVTEGLMATVRNAAPLVETRDIKSRSSQGTERLIELLDTFDEKNPGVKEFRILVRTEGKILVLVASQGRLRGRAGQGEVYKADKAILDAIERCIAEKKDYSTGLYEDQEGSWVSAFAPIVDKDGNVVGALAADEEAAAVRREETAITDQMIGYMASALVAAVLVGIYVSIRITRPLSRLYAASVEAREGRFKPVEVTGTDEVAALMRSFNETNTALEAKMKELELLNRELEQRVVSRTEQLSKSYEELRDRQQLLQREMAVARRVQETIIPKSLHREKITIDVEYVPILEIGGDIGIVAERAADKFDVAVGDVTGHGIGAALVVNRAHMFLTQLHATGAPLDALFHRLDYLFAQEIADIGIFMTVAACRFDLAAMTLEYGGAGHSPTILYRPSEDKTTLLESTCGILGTGNPWCDDPPVSTVSVRNGDFVLLYTDGLVEATNQDGEQFGRERLISTIRAAAGRGDHGKAIAKSLTEATKNFTGGYFQDDVLVLVVEIGSGNEAADGARQA